MKHLSCLKRLLAGAAVLALAGCATNESLLPPSLFGPQPGKNNYVQPPSDRESDKLIKLPAAAEDLDCPDVGVAEGGASSRVGGQTSDSVRYEFTIADVARECDPQGNQFALKVGVSGRLLLGPAGSPGTYATTLHVQVKRDADAKVLVDKTYRISADTAGAAQAPFRYVTEPFLLPLTRARLSNDYSIFVGLGQGGGAVMHTKRSRRHG